MTGGKVLLQLQALHPGLLRWLLLCFLVTLLDLESPNILDMALTSLAPSLWLAPSQFCRGTCLFLKFHKVVNSRSKLYQSLLAMPLVLLSHGYMAKESKEISRVVSDETWRLFIVKGLQFGFGTSILLLTSQEHLLFLSMWSGIHLFIHCSS